MKKYYIFEIVLPNLNSFNNSVKLISVHLVVLVKAKWILGVFPLHLFERFIKLGHFLTKLFLELIHILLKLFHMWFWIVQKIAEPFHHVDNHFVSVLIKLISALLWLSA